MAAEVTPERVAAIAASARIHLDATAAGRVARSVNPTVTRFIEEKITLPLEIEPATFVVVARKGIVR